MVNTPQDRQKIFDVQRTSTETSATTDGKDEIEVIRWEDGSTLQIFRKGMGARALAQIEGAQ